MFVINFRPVAKIKLSRDLKKSFENSLMQSGVKNEPRGSKDALAQQYDVKTLLRFGFFPHYSWNTTYTYILQKLILKYYIHTYLLQKEQLN